MNDQKKQQPQIKLDGYSKQKLGHAFMSLYAALVEKYQTQNMTLGAAWDKALRDIYEIVKSKKSETQSYDYLKKFYMSHRTEYVKKTVEHKDKDLIIQSNAEQVKAAAERVEAEIKKFDDAVQSVTGGEVLITLPPRNDILKPGFIDWVENQPNTDLDQDPRAFERAYRKYVMRQKHK